jgi:membrane fusion protein (multidrug efflux system)
LSSKVAGFIETVAVVDNQAIKAGDLLVKIDDRDYRAQLARAEASIAIQQATLANLDANRHLQMALIEQALLTLPLGLPS